MKNILILLFSLLSIVGFSQTIIPPGTAVSRIPINDAIQGCIPLTGTDTYTATVPGASYTTDDAYTFKFVNGNVTTTPTINLNPGSGALGAKSIRKYSAGSLVAVAANDLKGTMRLRYDGTYFVLDGIGNLAIAGSAPNATSSIRGISKLYTSTGSNTDGTMDQNSINNALTDVLNSVDTATYLKRAGTSIISSDISIQPNVPDLYSINLGTSNRFGYFNLFAYNVGTTTDSWTVTTDNFNVYTPGGEATISCGSGGLQLSTSSATTPLEIISGSTSQPVRIKGGSTILLESGSSNTKVYTVTTPTTNDDPTVDVWQKRVTTATATVTTLMTVPTTTDNTILITGFIIARRTGGASGTAGDGAGYRFEGVFKNVSGAVTQLGATITTIGESQAGWDVTLPISSSNILVSVTGATSNSITWHLSEIKIMSLNQ